MTNKPAWASLRPFKALESFQGVYVVPNTKDDFTLCMARNMEEANWIVAALNGEGQEEGLDPQYDGASYHEEPLKYDTPSPALEALISAYQGGFGKHSRIIPLIEAARQEAAGRAVPWCRSPQKAASGIRNAFGLAIAFGKPLPTEEKIVEIIQHCQGNAPIPPPDRSEELEQIAYECMEELKISDSKNSYYECVKIIKMALHRSTSLKAPVDVKKCAEEIADVLWTPGQEVLVPKLKAMNVQQVEAILNKHLKVTKKPKSEKDFIHGHKFTPENTRPERNGRSCRACKKIANNRPKP